MEEGGSPARIRITSHSLTQSLIYGEKHDYILRLPSDIGVGEGGKTKRAAVRACVHASPQSKQSSLKLIMQHNEAT